MIKKSFLPITFSVVIVFLLYQIISPTMEVSAKDGSAKATIAGIEITETKKIEIQSRLASEVEKWKSNDIIIEGTSAKVSIPSSYFTFDINKTADKFIALTETPWYKFWEGQKSIQLPIDVVIDENIKNLLKEARLFYVDETLTTVMEHAEYLKSGPIEATEVAFSKDNLERISFEIQDVALDGKGLSLLTEALNDITIVNNEQFSFLEMLEDVDDLYSEETADFVASTLYSAVLQTDLNILERHSQNALPKYLQPGIEAKVNKSRSQDLKFNNQTESPFMISAAVREGKLVVELYSFKSNYEITYAISNKEIIKPRTIYRLSADLPMGQEKVIENGKEGLRVQVFKKISEVNSSYEDEMLISRDFYPPKNKVVLVSSVKPAESTSEDKATDDNGTETSSPTKPEGESSKSGTDDDTTKKSQTTEKDKKIEDHEEKIYDKGGNLITSDEK